ncbi:hypothetical protein J7T55_007599 [Diaporthe amygdali]|uniref:uncharacterized protein n=1 Tax=Phomopsis amygdali TaxID=1214568 RepID=UPI0022FE0A05|nr:uncharacterized protein J7T55_007599 [Diaporthe amygdali]KAJ0107229.1 hypothetical protein J7T55_007599 [Diaporthe amygdali]
MVLTRGQAKYDEPSDASLSPGNPGTGKSRNKRMGGNVDGAIQPVSNKKAKTSTKKQQHTSDDKDKDAKSDDEDEKASKLSTASGQDAKIQSLIDKYGSLPLSNTDLKEPTSSATPKTTLALLLSAMLSSARISHDLAAKTTAEVIKAGYHDLETLKKSTWEERTEVLTKGGYTRYREKTATALGDLAEHISAHYDGDLNNLPKQAQNDPSKIRTALREIKQLGDVGVDVFFDTAQAAWPCLAPFVDPRSRETAAEIGIGGDVDKLWGAVGKDPVGMCKLAGALTLVRLEKREEEFKSG